MGKLIKSVNDLYTWICNNGERGRIILEEFTGLDENNILVDIHNIAYGSKRKLLWKCRLCKNNYIAAVYSRTSGKTDCKTCKNKAGAQKRNNNKIVNEGVSLFNWCKQNGLYGERLLSEWQGITTTGEDIDIHKVTHGSKVAVVWKCMVNSNHTWETQINSRTGRPRLCPLCSGKKVEQGKNDLYTWAYLNYTKLIDEWVGEDVHGNKLDIHEVAYSTHKKVKWRCCTNKSHIWNATISSRTNQYLGCPYCKITGTSFTEQVLYFYYKKLYTNTISRGKYQGYEFDITIPELRACIEYSGLEWHSRENTIIRDTKKRQICKEHSVKLIVILEDDDRCIKDSTEVYYDLIINRRNKREEKELYNLICDINNKLQIQDNNIEYNIAEAIKSTIRFLGGNNE